MKVHSWPSMNSVSQGAELVCNTSPFQAGRSVLLNVQVSSNFDGDFQFQQANDVAGTSWANVLTGTEVDYVKEGAGSIGGSASFEITLGEKVRPVITSYTRGSINFSLAAGA